MIPINPWEHQNAIKTLYSRCVNPICQKYNITRMELDILLFLANNPCFDTAKDIVEIRFLSKSQVSASVKSLEKREYLRKEFAEGNRKTEHLVICDKAAELIDDGRAAQERFLSVMLQGVCEEDMNGMKRCMEHMRENINRYLKEEMRS